jgi:TonB family protein
MPTPTNYLDKIQVASPCAVTWKSMTGDDASRHCDSCNLQVYNISEMTKQEAENFLARSIPKGRVCAKFYRRKDGTILTDDCPHGLRALRNTTRFIGAKAAALIALLISCLPAYSQSQSKQEQDPQSQKAGNPTPPTFGKPRVLPISEKHGRGIGTTLGVICPAQPDHNSTIEVISPVSKRLDWGAYIADCQRRIRRTWVPPKEWPEDTIKVNFKLHKDGSTSDIKLEKSSSSETANQAALRAIKESNFKPLQYPEDAIDIRFTFDSHSFEPKNTKF